MKVITAGFRYLDIDAYGGIVAYAELLNLLGEEACAVSTAPFNESITSTVQSWPTKLMCEYSPGENDEYVLVDLSDPEVFDTFVAQDKVVEIIDHHMEFEQMWREKLGDKAHIEFIGAACTLVYERWQAAGKLAQISETSARLLATGILDNTLNFEAGVTTERDRRAYQELMKHSNLSADWSAQYFDECQQETLADLPTAVKHDVKIVEFPSFSGKIGTGQLVVWNAKDTATTHRAEITEAMKSTGEHWFMNIVSISEGKNYLLASDATTQDFLSSLLGVVFSDGVATTDRLWLRKEIMKADLDRKR